LSEISNRSELQMDSWICQDRRRRSETSWAIKSN